jgi:hypothetical protein
MRHPQQPQLSMANLANLVSVLPPRNRTEGRWMSIWVESLSLELPLYTEGDAREAFAYSHMLNNNDLPDTYEELADIFRMEVRPKVVVPDELTLSPGEVSPNPLSWEIGGKDGKSEPYILALIPYRRFDPFDIKHLFSAVVSYELYVGSGGTGRPLNLKDIPTLVVYALHWGTFKKYPLLPRPHQ